MVTAVSPLDKGDFSALFNLYKGLVASAALGKRVRTVALDVLNDDEAQKVANYFRKNLAFAYTGKDLKLKNLEIRRQEDKRSWWTKFLDFFRPRRTYAANEDFQIIFTSVQQAIGAKETEKSAASSEEGAKQKQARIIQELQDLKNLWKILASLEVVETGSVRPAASAPQERAESKAPTDEAAQQTVFPAEKENVGEEQIGGEGGSLEESPQAQTVSPPPPLPKVPPARSVLDLASALRTAFESKTGDTGEAEQTEEGGAPQEKRGTEQSARVETEHSRACSNVVRETFSTPILVEKGKGIMLSDEMKKKEVNQRFEELATSVSKLPSDCERIEESEERLRGIEREISNLMPEVQTDFSRTMASSILLRREKMGEDEGEDEDAWDRPSTDSGAGTSGSEEVDRRVVAFQTKRDAISKKLRDLAQTLQGLTVSEKGEIDQTKIRTLAKTMKLLTSSPSLFRALYPEASLIDVPEAESEKKQGDEKEAREVQEQKAAVRRDQEAVFEQQIGQARQAIEFARENSLLKFEGEFQAWIKEWDEVLAGFDGKKLEDKQKSLSDFIRKSKDRMFIGWDKDRSKVRKWELINDVIRELEAAVAVLEQKPATAGKAGQLQQGSQTVAREKEVLPSAPPAAGVDDRQAKIHATLESVKKQKTAALSDIQAANGKRLEVAEQVRVMEDALQKAKSLMGRGAREDKRLLDNADASILAAETARAAIGNRGQEIDVLLGRACQARASIWTERESARKLLEAMSRERPGDVQTAKKDYASLDASIQELDAMLRPASELWRSLHQQISRFDAQKEELRLRLGEARKPKSAAQTTKGRQSPAQAAEKLVAGKPSVTGRALPSIPPAAAAKPVERAEEGFSVTVGVALEELGQAIRAAPKNKEGKPGASFEKARKLLKSLQTVTTVEDKRRLIDEAKRALQECSRIVGKQSNARERVTSALESLDEAKRTLPEEEKPPVAEAEEKKPTEAQAQQVREAEEAPPKVEARAEAERQERERKEKEATEAEAKKLAEEHVAAAAAKATEAEDVAQAASNVAKASVEAARAANSVVRKEVEEVESLLKAARANMDEANRTVSRAENSQDLSAAETAVRVVSAAQKAAAEAETRGQALKEQLVSVTSLIEAAQNKVKASAEAAATARSSAEEALAAMAGLPGETEAREKGRAAQQGVAEPEVQQELSDALQALRSAIGAIDTAPALVTEGERLAASAASVERAAKEKSAADAAKKQQEVKNRIETVAPQAEALDELLRAYEEEVASARHAQSNVEEFRQKADTATQKAKEDGTVDSAEEAIQAWTLVTKSLTDTQQHVDAALRAVATALTSADAVVREAQKITAAAEQAEKAAQTVGGEILKVAQETRRQSEELERKATEAQEKAREWETSQKKVQEEVGAKLKEAQTKGKAAGAAKMTAQEIERYRQEAEKAEEVAQTARTAAVDPIAEAERAIEELQTPLKEVRRQVEKANEKFQEAASKVEEAEREKRIVAANNAARTVEEAVSAIGQAIGQRNERPSRMESARTTIRAALDKATASEQAARAALVAEEKAAATIPNRDPGRVATARQHVDTEEASARKFREALEMIKKAMQELRLVPSEEAGRQLAKRALGIQESLEREQKEALEKEVAASLARADASSRATEGVAELPSPRDRLPGDLKKKKILSSQQGKTKEDQILNLINDPKFDLQKGPSAVAEKFKRYNFLPQVLQGGNPIAVLFICDTWCANASEFKKFPPPKDLASQLARKFVEGMGRQPPDPRYARVEAYLKAHETSPSVGNLYQNILDEMVVLRALKDLKESDAKAAVAKVKDDRTVGRREELTKRILQQYPDGTEKALFSFMHTLVTIDVFLQDDAVQILVQELTKRKKKVSEVAAIFDTEGHKKSKFYSALKLKWQESEPPESPGDIDIVDVTAS